MSHAEHLSADEIAALFSGDGTVLAAGRSEHAQECDLCRRLIAAHQAAARELEALKAGPREGRTAGCPPSEDWAWLAGGLVEPVRGKDLLDHAASCDACGTMLRGMMEDLTGDPGAREAAEISQLRTSSADWRRDFARKQTSGRTPSAPRWFTWAAAAAAFIAMAGGGRMAYVAWFSAQPERLIAQAYTEKRPFDFRIAGAAHGRKQQEKRGIGSTFDQPQALREAEARIGEKLQRNPDDVQWLALRARAEILRRNPEDAIAVLIRTLDMRPGDAALLADLGLAYAIRAENAKRDVDYTMAIEYLSRSLKVKPDVPEVIFNRALVYEQMYLYDLAIEEWRHCLRLEPSGPWADEARGRLSELEKKKKARKDALDRITDDPDAFHIAAASADFEPEPYLDIAITRWLPNRWSDAKYERALQTMAAKLREKHGDRWLADVLRAPWSEQLARGYEKLAEALQANRRERFKESIVHAREAATALNAAGSPAAAIRADAELIYALHLSYQTTECVDQAGISARAARTANYPWIAGQVLLEMGTCRNILGDSGGARRDRSLALAAARGSRFRTLELRAEGLIGGPQTSDANQLLTWDLGRASLRRFWDGVHPALRAQQIHDNMRRASENLDLPNAALAFSMAAVLALAETPNRLFEAVNRAVAANLASKVGLLQEAERQFETASAIFRNAGGSNPVHSVYAETWWAEAQFFRGHAPAARDRLRALLENAESLNSLLVQQQYFEVSGSAHWRSGDQEQARSSWEKAVELTEKRLASVRSPEERANVLTGASKAYRGLAEVYWTGEANIEEARNIWERFRSGDRALAARTQNADRSNLRNETFLSYAELPDGLVVWVIDNQHLEGRRLGVKHEDLARVARRFLRMCSDPASNSAVLHRDARQLYDWLVAPVARRLNPARTLVVEPDGPIGAIPMQALLDGDSKYLGERFSIVVASSAADYLGRSAVPPVTAVGKAILVADPVLGEQMSAVFPPLRQAVQEARIIAARFAVPKLLSGREATLGALEEHGRQAELLHFAGHGFSNGGNGGLLLASDDGTGAGVLDGQRLVGQDWSRCRLAVLSACSAGTGESRGSVNPESLVRRLLWSGVARVVASRWNVDAETSVQLFREFYSALLSGKDAAASLRHASEHLRKSAATHHPYFWAGFQVYGAR